MAADTPTSAGKTFYGLEEEMHSRSCSPSFHDQPDLMKVDDSVVMDSLLVDDSKSGTKRRGRPRKRPYDDGKPPSTTESPSPPPTDATDLNVDGGMQISIKEEEKADEVELIVKDVMPPPSPPPLRMRERKPPNMLSKKQEALSSKGKQRKTKAAIKNLKLKKKAKVIPAKAKVVKKASTLLGSYVKAFHKKTKLMNANKAALNKAESTGNDANQKNAIVNSDTPPMAPATSTSDDFPTIFLDEVRGAKVGALKAIMSQQKPKKNVTTPTANGVPSTKAFTTSKMPTAPAPPKKPKVLEPLKSNLSADGAKIKTAAALKKRPACKSNALKDERNGTSVENGQNSRMVDGDFIEIVRNFQSVEVALSSLPSQMPPAPVFDYLETNVLLCDDASSRESKTIRCMCAPTAEQLRAGRGCGDDCLNRQLFMECGSRCPSGKLCTNKQFQRRLYADLEIFPAGLKGWGLRARAPIAKSQFIIEYVGEVVDGFEKARRIKRYGKDPRHKHHYFMALRNDAVIDATTKGNLSRFINHSCDPNAVTQKWSVNRQLRVGFFALRPIAPGEEIVFNYQFERYGKKAQPCYCGTSNCTGFIGGQTADRTASDGDDDSDACSSSASSSSESSDSEYETSSAAKAKAKKPAAHKPLKPAAVSSTAALSSVNRSLIDGDKLDNVEKTIARMKKERSTKQFVKRVEMEKEKMKALELAEVSDLLKKGPLKTKEDVLEFNRVMVRVDQAESRKRMIEFLLHINDVEVLRLFVQNQGLGLLRIWFVMPDTAESKTLKMRNNIVRLLLRLPIENQQQIDEAAILPTMKHVRNNMLSDEAIVEDVLMDIVYKTALKDTPSHQNIRPDSLIVEHANLQLNLQKVMNKWSQLSLAKPAKQNEADSNTDMVIDSDDEHSETPPISSVASSHYRQYVSISRGIHPSNGFKNYRFTPNDNKSTKFQRFNQFGMDAQQKPRPICSLAAARPSPLASVKCTPPLTHSSQQQPPTAPRESRFSNQPPSFDRASGSLAPQSMSGAASAVLPPPGLVFPMATHMQMQSMPPPVMLFAPHMNMMMNMSASTSFFPPPPPPPMPAKEAEETPTSAAAGLVDISTPKVLGETSDDFQLMKGNNRSITESNNYSKGRPTDSQVPYSPGSDMSMEENELCIDTVTYNSITKSEPISVDGPPHPPPLRPCHLSSERATQLYIDSLNDYIGSMHEYIAMLRKYNASDAIEFATPAESCSTVTVCRSESKITGETFPVKTETAEDVIDSSSVTATPATTSIGAGDVKRKRNGETITPPEDPLNEATADVPVEAKKVEKVPCKSGKWYSSLDSEGTRYYFHVDTQESTWELPENERLPEPESAVVVIEKVEEEKNGMAAKNEENSFLSEAERKRYAFKRQVSDFISKQLQPYRKRFFADTDEFIQFIRKVTRKVLDSQDKSNQDLKFTDTVRSNTKRLVDEYIRIFKASRAPPLISITASAMSSNSHHRHSLTVAKRRSDAGAATTSENMDIIP